MSRIRYCGSDVDGFDVLLHYTNGKKVLTVRFCDAGGQSTRLVRVEDLSTSKVLTQKVVASVAKGDVVARDIVSGFFYADLEEVLDEVANLHRERWMKNHPKSVIVISL